MKFKGTTTLGTMDVWLSHPYRQPVVGWPKDIDASEYDAVLR